MKMKHAGSCDKTCGHALDIMTVPYSTLVQQLLDRDPRVIEYKALDNEWLEVVYAYKRPVAAIYRASAAQLGITELS
jgi:putative SOS response-associated peptidase YedK